MTDLVEQALAARDRVAAGWCQNFLALRADGDWCWQPDDPDAVAWCVRGAVMAEKVEPLFMDWFYENRATEAERRRHCIDAAVFWNNAPERTQAEVVALLDDFATHLKEQSNG